jgi:phage tail-like protein
MDVNGTRFQLLLSFDDWASCIDADAPTPQLLSQSWQATCTATGTAWDAERAELILRPSLFQFPSTTVHNELRPYRQERRRGASQDYAGRWYWISDDGTELLVQWQDMSQREHFWSADDDDTGDQTATGFGDFQPVAAPAQRKKLPLSGLTITREQYLVVGVVEPAGLLIFDLYTSEPPRQLLWSAMIPFVPFDMAARPGGGVVILDRIHKRYWSLDRYFNVQAQEQQIAQVAPEQVDIFQPVGATGEEAVRETPAQFFPEGIALNIGSPLEASDPVAIDVLPDDTVLILERNADEPFSRISFYRSGQQAHPPVSLEAVTGLIPPDQQMDFHLRGHDFAFVPADTNAPGVAQSGVQGRLYIVNEEGNQCYAFTVLRQQHQIVLQPVSSYFPLHRFGGRGLVVGAAGKAGQTGQQVFYDMQNTWLPLVEQPRPRFALTATVQTFLSSQPGLQANAGGQVLRPAFDGHMSDCVWHRLLLDAYIPPETKVQVWSRAANREDELADTDWQPEPDLYLRRDGSELPFTPPVTGVGNGTWELLFQAARGRYLQVQLVLSGNGRTTPQLRAMRVYYPRFSYLEHYLPAVYREDVNSASFVERFLANVEGFFTTIEDKISAVSLLFDVRSVPAEALDWLANWFGIALDMAWNERKKRLFLKHAMDYFQYRGTLHGLLIALQLALEEHPSESIFSHRHHKHAQTPGRPQGIAPTIESIFSHHHHKHARTHGISIVEQFRTRRFPGALFAPVDGGDPRFQVDQSNRWLPAQGGERLNQLYQQYLQQQDLDVENMEGQGDSFPLTAPLDATLNAAWRQFAQQTLEFIPTATEADLPLWRKFLIYRYQSIDVCNVVYRTTFTSFWQVPLLAYLPEESIPCYDWYIFEEVVLQMQRTAHQFTVYLPMPATNDADHMQQQRDLVQRILDSEKPAHTVFDVQFYIATFRLGATTLGANTQIGVGSRSTLLPPALMLGEGVLADGYLTTGDIQGPPGGYALGQEQLRR